VHNFSVLVPGDLWTRTSPHSSCQCDRHKGDWCFDRGGLHHRKAHFIDIGTLYAAIAFIGTIIIGQICRKRRTMLAIDVISTVSWRQDPYQDNREQWGC